MKLRLEENSLRLRLSGDEVQQFAETGRLAQTLRLGPAPGQQLRCELVQLPAVPERPDTDGDTLRLRYEDGQVAVEMSAALAREWVGSKKVGVAAQIDVGGGHELRIVVEKDLGYQH